MTLQEFRATRTECANIGRVLSDERWEGASGYVYLGSLFIQRTEAGPVLYIDNWIYEGKPLEELEEVLFEWAKSAGYSV